MFCRFQLQERFDTRDSSNNAGKHESLRLPVIAPNYCNMHGLQHCRCTRRATERNTVRYKNVSWQERFYEIVKHVKLKATSNTRTNEKVCLGGVLQKGPRRAAEEEKFLSLQHHSTQKTSYKSLVEGMFANIFQIKIKNVKTVPVSEDCSTCQIHPRLGYRSKNVLRKQSRGTFSSWNECVYEIKGMCFAKWYNTLLPSFCITWKSTFPTLGGFS